jgi:arylformamidase
MPSNDRLIDVSIAIQPGMLVYPGDPEVTMRPAARISEGDDVNLTQLEIATHVGTHIDSPWHFFDDGERLASIALDRLIGPCQVIDLSSETADIDAEVLDAARIPEDTSRLILKTRNSEFWATDPETFRDDYIGISSSGARWLIDRGIDFIGIDYLTVEPADSDGETHRMLLGAGIVILETIDLRDVLPGEYTLYCLPLRIDDGDGAPARVVLGTRA